MNRAYKFAAAFLLGIAQCIAAFAAEPIRVGVSLGLTGQEAEPSKLHKNAYELWEEQVNARGGIMGRPVKVIIRDDKSDAKNAAAIYEQLITKEKVDFVFGPYSTVINLAVAEVIDRHRYPMPIAGGASDEIYSKGYKHVFAVSTPLSRNVAAVFGFLAAQKLRKVAIVGNEDAYSKIVVGSAKTKAAEYGVDLVAIQTLDKKNPDYAGAARAARDAKAEVLLMAGRYPESVGMRKALKAVGWMPALYWATVGPGLPKFGQDLGADATGTIATGVWEPLEQLRLPGSQEFIKSYRTKYNELPAATAGNAFAATQILEKAILTAKSFDRVEVRNAMASMDFDTMVGRYAVNEAGIQVKRQPIIIQWQNGKREIIWPEVMRTAKPLVNK